MKRKNVLEILDSCVDFCHLTLGEVFVQLNKYSDLYAEGYTKLWFDEAYMDSTDSPIILQLVGVRLENDKEFAMREALVKKEKESLQKVKEEMDDRERKLYEKLKKIFEKS